MLDSPLDLIAILSLVWFVLAAALFQALGRIRRLERMAGVRSARPRVRRRGRLPKQSHIRTVGVLVEKRAG